MPPIENLDPLTLEIVQRADERVRIELDRSGSAEALLESSTPPASDSAHTAIEQLLAQRAPDGSWGRSVTQTAQALVTVAKLSNSASLPLPASGDSSLAYLRTRVGARGRFGDSCDTERHRLGVCPHFLPPLAAPSEVDERALAATDDRALEDLRLTAAAGTVRAFQAWGTRGTDQTLLLGCVARIVTLWADEALDPWISAQGIVQPLHAMLESERVTSAADGIARLLRSQRADGTWPDAELLSIVDLLLSALRHGFELDEVHAAVERTTKLLASGFNDAVRARLLQPRELVILRGAFSVALKRPPG